MLLWLSFIFFKFNKSITSELELDSELELELNDHVTEAPTRGVL